MSYRVVEVTPQTFLETFDRARALDPEIERHTVRLNTSTLAEQYRCYLLKSNEFIPAGFIVERGDKSRLRCMFNATDLALASIMIQYAKQAGARSLNCPADWREKMYRKHGFKAVSRLVFMELEESNG